MLFLEFFKGKEKHPISFLYTAASECAIEDVDSRQQTAKETKQQQQQKSRKQAKIILKSDFFCS